uniref:ABC transporter domain-containing protein n=2 Tax=cellular organisms TaxID=131567 RepID=A0AA38XEC6_9EURO|nr:hypothetical protein H2204_015091 [Knufia peltigerae]
MAGFGGHPRNCLSEAHLDRFSGLAEHRSNRNHYSGNPSFGRRCRSARTDCRIVPRENVYMAEWATVFDCSGRRHAATAQSSLPSGGPRQSQKTARRRADWMSEMAKVQLQGVRKVYDNGQVAVKDATFEVADGELMVLVGPSGCGKSTLLRMVAGLEEISGGTLTIGDRVVNDVAPKDRDIAMVFQSYALYPHMTVAENLAFGLKLRGHDKATIDKRISEAAQTLGLTEMMDKLPKAMSGGQRQRVALGRALVREPAVFLLDEPLSNLDAKLRHSVRTEIAQLHRKLGTTMIYVTHDQVEAMTLGQRIVVLKDGVIQQIDTPMALYDRPANLFVAGFLGSPAMNVLRGTLQGDAGGVTVVDGAWQAPLGQATIDPAWLQKPIAVGVRPEHLQPADSEDTHAFTARVEGIEPVGNEIFVNMSSGQHALTMRVAPQSLPGVGEDIRVAIHPQGLHFFNPETGERL